MTPVGDQIAAGPTAWLVNSTSGGYASVHFASPGFDYTHEFDFGLELVLDGLATLRDGQRG